MRFLTLICIFFIFIEHINAEEISDKNKKELHDVQQQMRDDLISGKTDDARAILDNAAGHFHAVEIELGQIQTLMQVGEYRHALSAAAHTQSEHTDSQDAVIFYAWLLAIAGHFPQATQLLENHLQDHPQQSSVQTTLTQLKSHQLNSETINTSNAIQLSPFISNSKKNNNLFLTSGLLVDKGRKILVLKNSLGDYKHFDVRLNNGQINDAIKDETFIDDQFALLNLSTPTPFSTSVKLNHQPTSMGKPIYWIGFMKNSLHKTEWPFLKTDVLGTPSTNENNFSIHFTGIETGGLVFNANGELIGLSQSFIDKDSKVIAINQQLSYLFITDEKTLTSNTMIKAMDEVYEESLDNLARVFANTEKAK